MKTAKINLSVQGVKGGENKHFPDRGYVSIDIDQGGLYAPCSSITVDAFSGQGANYKRREESEITIQLGARTWTGSMSELIFLLTGRTVDA